MTPHDHQGKEAYWCQKKRRCLTSLPHRPQDQKNIIAVDIETGVPGEATLGGTFVLGAWVSEADPDYTNYFSDVGEWVTAIFAKRNRGSVWVAHNGGEYDYRYLVEYLIAHRDDYPGLEHYLLCRSDGRIIAIVLKRDKQKYLLLDTYALIPDALSRVTSALAPELVKLSRSWVLPDGSTNYFSPDSEEDRAYLARDVRGLLVAVRRFKDTIFQLFDINTGYTAGGTAMRAWRRSLPEDVTYWRQHPRVDALGREAYKGGLIIFTRCDRQYDMVHVDVNAMYAWAMAQGVPVGRGILTDHEVVGYPGIYRVELRVPASERYPFIGSNGVPSLKPTGVFSATVTSVELVEARRRGYSYVVQDGCYFEEMGHPFEQFLSQAQALEMDHKGDALGYAVKIMRNSLYGKFGSQPASMNYVLTESPREGLTPVVDPHTGALVPCLYAQAATIDEPYLQPVWAAFITAHARVRLAQLARRLEGVYGDTDSVVFPARNLESALADGSLRISRTYGDVKIEHHYRWFQCGGPKNYQAQTDSGELIDRAKGIPRSLLNQDSIPVRVDGVAQNMPAMEAHALALAGHAVEVVYLSMNSTLASLKRGRAKTEDRRRSYSRLERSEQWRADGTGAVYPVQLSGETRAVANTG